MTATNQRKTDYEEQTEKIARRMERIDHVVMVLSGKGGVGRNTVAANLASPWPRAVGGWGCSMPTARATIRSSPASPNRWYRHRRAIRPVELPSGLAVMSVAS